MDGGDGGDSDFLVAIACRGDGGDFLVLGSILEVLTFEVE